MKRKKDPYEYFQFITDEGLKDTPKKVVTYEPEKKEIKVPELNPAIMIDNALNLYEFKGSVLQFDKTVIPNFIGKTKAVSEAKAISNLTFRAKRELKLEASAGGIKLVGSIKKIEG